MKRIPRIEILLLAVSAVATSQTRNPNTAPAPGKSAGPSAAAEDTVLTVRGQTGQAPVIRRDGRSYVDIESLARVTGASLNFQDNKIILTLPGGVVPPPSVAAAPQAKPEDPGLTRDFLRSGVEMMAVVREWRSAIENAIRTNNPVEERWVSPYRRNAEARMQMAIASASSNADRDALPSLQGALGMMRQLSDRFLALRASLTFVPTNALDNDPLDQRILECAQGMTAQAVPGGRFEDVSACR